MKWRCFLAQQQAHGTPPDWPCRWRLCGRRRAESSSRWPRRRVHARCTCSSVGVCRLLLSLRKLDSMRCSRPQEREMESFMTARLLTITAMCLIALVSGTLYAGWAAAGGVAGAKRPPTPPRGPTRLRASATSSVGRVPHRGPPSRQETACSRDTAIQVAMRWARGFARASPLGPSYWLLANRAANGAIVDFGDYAARLCAKSAWPNA
jgi:hypothetical protein